MLPSPPAARNSDNRTTTRVAFALAVGTILLFSPVRGFEFLNFDDPACVTAEPRVKAGLSADGIAWAFRSVVVAHWKPLTTISHMADCELFGLDPAAHHLVNVAWHAGAVVLLFLTLRLMTGSMWRSALVAALFAWHPLRVESVAWVTERKDVLSGFFWMLSLWLYARHVKRPTRRSWAAVLGAFTLGLLSKSILVALPFVLLLLDVWPLKRVELGNSIASLAAAWHGPLRALVFEKAPMFVLALAAAAVAWWASQSVGGVLPSEMFPADFRAANGLVSFGRYLWKTVWPVDLAVLYPFPEHWPAVTVITAAVVLVLILWQVVRHLSPCPWLAVGCLWFYGVLVPVSGVVQAGPQAMADRYTYLPHVGLFLAAVWGAAELASRLHLTARMQAVFAGAVLIAFASVTSFQLRFWRNSESLFRRAILVTGGSDITHMNLGETLARQGRFAEAVNEYESALRFRERSFAFKRLPAHLLAEAHRSLGTALIAAGRTADAVANLERARALQADDPDTLAALGTALGLQGRREDAVTLLKQAVRVQPSHRRALENLVALLTEMQRGEEAATFLWESIASAPNLTEPRYQLANVLADLGRAQESITACQDVLNLDPRHARALFNLGNHFHVQGRPSEAMAAFEAAAGSEPDFAPARFNLGALLLQSGRAADATRHFEAGLRSDPNSIEGHYNLAQALAQLGRAAEARKHMEVAQRLNSARSAPK